MNIEDLSKSQLLLLMILVNFITSIATGVLTVSLLDQAPATVTQTVNRIVDHTIETIGTSSPLATIISPPGITKTIIENNDQLLTAAVGSESARLVNIYGIGGTTTPLLAVGTYLPAARAIVTATQVGLTNSVTIQFRDGSTKPASISHTGATLTIYGFADATTLPAAPSPSIVSSTALKQGQQVVAITADGSAVTGIVSKVDATEVHTNLPAVPAGSAAVDTSGNIIGISSGVAGTFFPAEKITTLLSATTPPTGP